MSVRSRVCPRAGWLHRAARGGFYSARRGTYRIVYRIDEAKRLVEIYSIRHRRDAYRT